MYQIGIFSKLNQVSVKTLHHYDEIGLLKPIKIDTETGYRYYDLSQSYVLHRIQSLKRMGFRLDEIKLLLSEDSSQQLLFEKKAQLLAEITEKNRSLVQLEYYIAKHQFGQENYEVLVKELPEITVATYTTVLSTYRDLFQVMQQVASFSIKKTTPEYCFTQYLDAEYKETDIAVTVCEAVTNIDKNHSNITYQTLPKVPKAACLFHRGSYETLPHAYSLLMDWIEKNNLVPDGLARESYLKGSWNDLEEAKWLTEIQLPVMNRKQN